MRWPPRRFRKDPAGHARADAALRLSVEQREEAAAAAEEDRDRLSVFRRWQRENHFAEAFAKALGEGR